ncbi:hypothetical protein [Cupriavidus pauculus]|uniref:hypothetical protein n=1 Tax=Cupriavidus pauculus TaxID=82633 RepID=UPI0011AFD224|nr:hypothetical protein [Cupriavidus pauculus]
MATYERGGVVIVSGVEEITGGRYRGQLTIDTGGGIWLYCCAKFRNTPLDARTDADADVEYAYRKFLAEPLGAQRPCNLH